ncbi:MAG: histidine phosphatase family protein [Betaproteobacteria bacterium]|nr:histidine phosphatase family protein [Betaproteobacteria bacterium]
MNRGYCRKAMYGLAGGLVFGLFALAGLAQPAAGPPTSFPRIPPVEPRKALDGRALVEALRGGGFVLFFRHAETGTISETCESSNLTEPGRRDARRIGEALKQLKIPFDRAISSPVCRSFETAQLIDVAKVEKNDDLQRTPLRPDHRLHEGRAKLLGEAPAKGTNRLLSGHMQHGEKPEHRLYLDMAEAVIFKPRGDGQVDVVARVRAHEWQGLIAQMNAPPGK